MVDQPFLIFFSAGISHSLEGKSHPVFLRTPLRIDFFSSDPLSHQDFGFFFFPGPPLKSLPSLESVYEPDVPRTPEGFWHFLLPERVLSVAI